jgi:hypothetical protein
MRDMNINQIDRETLDEMIREDKPLVDGLYLVYTDHDVVKRFAERRLMLWSSGKWCYLGSDQFFRGHVYGCIGPFPSMELEDPIAKET